MTSPTGIDPRGPRFTASITSILLAVALVLSLIGISTAPGESASAWLISSTTFAERAVDPGFIALLVIAGLFLWGVLSPVTSPWAVLFRRLVRPRLSPPTDLEDPRPPRFAQGVGLLVVSIGLILHLVGVPLALPIAAAAAFVAAFLNAAIGFCLGCQIYLVLQRIGVTGRAARPV
ncbi:MAG: DUF4395 domain-containing protein [Actinomycetota bacterium]